MARLQGRENGPVETGEEALTRKGLPLPESSPYTLKVAGDFSRLVADPDWL